MSYEVGNVYAQKSGEHRDLSYSLPSTGSPTVNGSTAPTADPESADPIQQTKIKLNSGDTISSAIDLLKRWEEQHHQDVPFEPTSVTPELQVQPLRVSRSETLAVYSRRIAFYTILRAEIGRTSRAGWARWRAEVGPTPPTSLRDQLQ